tara:strand:+ start:143 stop:451 length:309 start_codon:yes stop_codon:yes gene_type:complete
MEIWYKEDTGMTNPQNNNLDYFKIVRIGEDYSTSSNFADVVFYQLLTDAQNDEIPPSARTAIWSPTVDSISQMEVDLFSLATVSTTSGDSISLQDPVLQPNE